MKNENATPQQVEEILALCKVCRLAMIAEGKPYIVPLNFGYDWQEGALTLYFHSGLRGKKIDAMQQNPQVSFEMDWEGGVTGAGDVAAKYSYAFRSIVGEGRVQFAATTDEKRHGFQRIMLHQTGREGWTFTEAQLAAAAVFSVRADAVSTASKAPRPR